MTYVGELSHADVCQDTTGRLSTFEAVDWPGAHMLVEVRHDSPSTLRLRPNRLLISLT